MAFWKKKKKSSNLVRHQRTFSNFFSLLKNYYYSLSEQNVGSSFTGKSKVNTIWSSLSSLTLVSQKGISFRGIPLSVTPTLPESFSPSWQLLPSVCVSHCSFPAGSFSYVFFLWGRVSWSPGWPYFYSRSLAPPSKCCDYRCSETCLLLHLLWLLPANGGR